MIEIAQIWDLKQYNKNVLPLNQCIYSPQITWSTLKRAYSWTQYMMPRMLHQCKSLPSYKIPGHYEFDSPLTSFFTTFKSSCILGSSGTSLLPWPKNTFESPCSMTGLGLEEQVSPPSSFSDLEWPELNRDCPGLYSAMAGRSCK